jgi:putative membrane protein
LPEFISGLIAFAVYFAAALAYGAAFCVIYTRLTPHREFDLIINEHNASAAVALGGSLIGFAIALAGAIHNTQSALEFIVWGFVALTTQLIAYLLARVAYPGLSRAIEQNVLAAAVWVGAVSISAGVVSAACMSP